jgi:hypothetical protein
MREASVMLSRSENVVIAASTRAPGKYAAAPGAARREEAANPCGTGLLTILDGLGRCTGAAGRIGDAGAGVGSAALAGVGRLVPVGTTTGPGASISTVSDPGMPSVVMHKSNLDVNEARTANTWMHAGCSACTSTPLRWGCNCNRLFSAGVSLVEAIVPSVCHITWWCQR